MTDITLEQRARELLAAEFRRELWHSDAAEVMAGEGDQIYGPALRAIEAALRLSAEADWVPPAKHPDDGNGDDDAYNAGWNACRAAMIAAAPRHEPGE